MPTAAVTAVLESIDVGSGEREVRRVLDVDLAGVLKRSEELYGQSVVLHDGSRIFIQASTVEAPAEGTRIAIHGPDRVAIEGIRFCVIKVHHVRMLRSE